MADENEEVVLLRDILARELETINVYLDLLGRAEQPEIIEFINHIVDEEKEHVAEAMQLINLLDGRQAARFSAGDHWRDATTQATPIETESESEETRAGSYTVGSLRGGKGD